MNKKDLSERDICTKFINPTIEKAGWHMKKQVHLLTDVLLFKENYTPEAEAKELIISCTLNPTYQLL